MHIAKKLDLADRINTTAERESFITLKDHKENFKNKPTCRLINPCKPEIGKICKQLLEKKIVKVVKDKTQYNHWKNTHDVIKWFGDIPNKKSHIVWFPRPEWVTTHVKLSIPQSAHWKISKQNFCSNGTWIWPSVDLAEVTQGQTLVGSGSMDIHSKILRIEYLCSTKKLS